MPAEMLSAPWSPNVAALREAFDRPGPLTVGLEEEVMLLDPGTLDLAPVAPSLVDELGDPRFKAELPGAQLELVCTPAETVGAAAAQMQRARSDLTAATSGHLLLASAGTHAFTAAEGEINPDERYADTVERYGPVARRQLVFGLHIHVAVRGAERALAVYNALRSYLPALAALAANAPFAAGRDSGLASVRPTIAAQLPRQGVPPVIPSWQEFAEALSWGATTGLVTQPRRWWWELRPHPVLGTIEVRVPDSQTEVWQSAALAAVVQCLAAWLVELHDTGQALEALPSWRIAENRWSACRYGLAGELADLTSGTLYPTRRYVNDLLERLTPIAARLGATRQLSDAGLLTAANGAERQRAVADQEGVLGTVAWLAERFAAPREEATR